MKIAMIRFMQYSLQYVWLIRNIFNKWVIIIKNCLEQNLQDEINMSFWKQICETSTSRRQFIHLLHERVKLELLPENFAAALSPISIHERFTLWGSLVAQSIFEQKTGEQSCEKKCCNHWDGPLSPWPFVKI